MSSLRRNRTLIVYASCSLPLLGSNKMLRLEKRWFEDSRRLKKLVGSSNARYVLNFTGRKSNARRESVRSLSMFLARSPKDLASSLTLLFPKLVEVKSAFWQQRKLATLLLVLRRHQLRPLQRLENRRKRRCRRSSQRVNSS